MAKYCSFYFKAFLMSRFYAFSAQIQGFTPTVDKYILVGIPEMA